MTPILPMTGPGASMAPLLAGARLDHVAIVVRDREASIRGLSILVSGPFDRFEYTNTALVLGERCTYTLHMGLARLSPEVDLEVIQLASGRHPIHEEFLRDRGEGLQHVAYEVADFGASVAAFGNAGFAPMLQKEGGTAVSIYVDTRAACGFFIELIRKGFRMRDPSTWPK